MEEKRVTSTNEDNRNSRAAAKHSLRALYVQYRIELVRFVRRRVGEGPPEPEDIAQQAFANFAAIEDPVAVKNPRAFLYRTAANLISDFHRRSENRLKFDVDDAKFEEIFGEHDQLTPEIVILERERFYRVDLAIRSLPRRQRRFLLLSRLDGMSYTDIARRNGVSISTVRREVEAAVRACREAVEHLIGDVE